MLKNKKIYPAYVWKHNSNCEKQVILLMISNGEKLWIYLTVKELSALLGRITPIYHGNFFVSIPFILLQQKKSLNRIKKYAKIKIFMM